MNLLMVHKRLSEVRGQREFVMRPLCSAALKAHGPLYALLSSASVHKMFIAKWSLVSWNSFGSQQIYHRLSATQTAAWKWAAKQMHFICAGASRHCYFSPLWKWGAEAGRSQPEGDGDLTQKWLIYRSPQSLVFFVLYFNDKHQTFQHRGRQ